MLNKGSNPVVQEQGGAKIVKFVIEMTVYPSGLIFTGKMYPIGEQRAKNKTATPKKSKRKEVVDKAVVKDVEEL